MRQLLLYLVLLIFTLSSCGRKKKALSRELALKTEQAVQLEEQLEHLQYTNASLLDRMSDLSVVSKAGAESIQKSLESISQQYDFIQDLTKKIQYKDSLNLALVMNLKRSLADINDEDVQIEVREGIVHVSISDKLLFRSGSAVINQEAKQVLEKLSSVLHDHEALNIVVEGHTDDVPIATECLADNWDLSVKRATSVVRMLQDEYYVPSERMTASGRAEYAPKDDNSTELGRRTNRRTEILIAPKLDQFFKLLEAPELKG
jgi:chemotaxis protein MotB